MFWLLRGDEAKDTMKSFCQVLKSIDEYASKVEMDGREVSWLHTYHPACYGKFNGQRNFDRTSWRARDWEKYSCMICKFVEQKT